MPASDQIQCDVLVVGSGAAGLMAAISARARGLDVQVVEKDAWVGGCSAYSHGMIWMPDNPVARRAGIEDSREAAATYLRGEMGERYSEAELATYLEHGPEVMAFLERECGLRLELREQFPDYHSEAPGASQNGRTILPSSYDARVLGADLKRLRPGRASFLGLSFTPSENRLISSRSARGIAYLGRRILRHLKDLLLYGRTTRLAGGSAIVASLFHKARQLGIPIHTQACVEGLLQRDGRVDGATVAFKGHRWEVQASRGVVLASGGFGQDLARCRDWMGHPPLDDRSWSLAPASCSGDGVRMAAELGAAVDLEVGNAGFWVPVSQWPGPQRYLSTHSHDRFQPGFLAVTPEGRRFANEAESNHHFCEALLRATPKGQSPEAWIVCDHTAINRVGFGDLIHGWPFSLKPFLRSGYLLRHNSLSGLAREMNVDEAAFGRTVDAFNEAAAQGRDPEFGKGESRFNRVMSRSAPSSHPCLRPLTKGPFYAIRITVGYMATLAGLRADFDGRALNAAGEPVAGLYVAGNDRVNLFRGACPGGGITLGPGLTWAYLTGQSLAGGMSRQPVEHTRRDDEPARVVPAYP